MELSCKKNTLNKKLGEIKEFLGCGYKIMALKHITSNNFIVCGNTIVLNSTNPNVCEILRDYEEFKKRCYLYKK